MGARDGSSWKLGALNVDVDVDGIAAEFEEGGRLRRHPNATDSASQIRAQEVATADVPATGCPFC